MVNQWLTHNGPLGGAFDLAVAQCDAWTGGWRESILWVFHGFHLGFWLVGDVLNYVVGGFKHFFAFTPVWGRFPF